MILRLTLQASFSLFFFLGCWFSPSALGAPLSFLPGQVAYADSSSLGISSKLNHQNASSLAALPIAAMATIGIYDASSIGAFWDFGGKMKDKNYAETLEKTGALEIGTGFVYQYQGKKYVITAAHLVHYADVAEPTIKAFDVHGNPSTMRILGRDAFYDIAVLAFEQEKDADRFEHLSFASDQNDKKGIAFGNALASNSFKGNGGRISGRRKTFKHANPLTPDLGYLETKAKLGAGFSGGPLCNKNNEIIGIHTQRLHHPKRFFALEASIAKQVIERLIEHQTIRRVFLGLRFHQLDGKVLIDEVLENSPSGCAAEQLLNQYVYSINETPIQSIFDVLRILENVKAGTSVTLKLSSGIQIIPTESLDKKNLVEIAKHFFQTNSKARYQGIEEVKTNVYLLKAGKTTSKDHLKLVGLKQTNGFYMLYRVKSAAKLGALIRLLTLYGKVDLVLNNHADFAPSLRFSFGGSVLYF